MMTTWYDKEDVRDWCERRQQDIDAHLDVVEDEGALHDANAFADQAMLEVLKWECERFGLDVS